MKSRLNPSPDLKGNRSKPYAPTNDLWIRVKGSEATKEVMTAGREPHQFDAERWRLDELASSDAKTNGVGGGSERQPLVKSWLQFDYADDLTTGSFGVERKDDWDNIYRVIVKSN